MPFLYGIQGVENFDVIDFPGVDDQDDSISDLVNLIRTLSQLVVFVVNYRYSLCSLHMYCTCHGLYFKYLIVTLLPGSRRWFLHDCMDAYCVPLWGNPTTTIVVY